MPRKPRRNPAAGIFTKFLSGVTANLGTAVAAAAETVLISAGAIAIDRLLLKHGQAIPGAPVNPTASPAALEQFLRSSKAATLLSAATVLQAGTLPGTNTHEVVFSLPGGTRLAARCLSDGQITLKHLPAAPATAAATVTETQPVPPSPPPPPPTKATPAYGDSGIIDCTQSANGEWEPVA